MKYIYKSKQEYRDKPPIARPFLKFGALVGRVFKRPLGKDDYFKAKIYVRRFRRFKIVIKSHQYGKMKFFFGSPNKDASLNGVPMEAQTLISMAVSDMLNHSYQNKAGFAYSLHKAKFLLKRFPVALLQNYKVKTAYNKLVDRCKSTYADKQSRATKNDKGVIFTHYKKKINSVEKFSNNKKGTIANFTTKHQNIKNKNNTAKKDKDSSKKQETPANLTGIDETTQTEIIETNETVNPTQPTGLSL